MQTASWSIDPSWQKAFDDVQQLPSQAAWCQALAKPYQAFIEDSWVTETLARFEALPRLVWIDGVFQPNFSTATYSRTQIPGDELSQLQHDYFNALDLREHTVAKLMPLVVGECCAHYHLSEDQPTTVQLLSLVTQSAAQVQAMRLHFAKGTFTLQQQTLVKPGVDAYASQYGVLSIGQEAVVTHAQVHSDSMNVHEHWQILQDEASEYRYCTLLLATGQQRSERIVTQKGQRAKTSLSGLLLGEGTSDHHQQWRVNHHVAHGLSDMHFRAIMSDRATASWQGHAHVEKDTPHCAITQMCRQLMTSHQARMHAKPTLTIYCDEVTCTHGATSGQLDDAALFYCQSRGLPLAQAQSLLMMAFVNELLSEWQLPWLSEWVAGYFNLEVDALREAMDECVA